MEGESSPETALITENVMKKEVRLTGNVVEEEMSSWVRRRYFDIVEGHRWGLTGIGNG